MAMTKAIYPADVQIDYKFWNLKTQEGIPEETHRY